jgi:hypothetical protein
LLIIDGLNGCILVTTLIQRRLPWIGIHFFQFLKSLVNIASIVKCLLNIVDKELGSCLIVGCLLGWSEVIIIVIDWLFDFFLGHATWLHYWLLGSPSCISVASMAWITTHGVFEP